jgi:tRNA pseudouridine55 synthase
MQSGVILVDKPYGYSSARVVGLVKRTHKFDKIGHAGTLDPAATGLLVLLTGRATRLVSFVQSGVKEYSGEFLFGLATDTDDVTGRIIKRSHVLPKLKDLLDIIPSFTGKISQVPPNVSAVKVSGVRAYVISRHLRATNMDQAENCRNEPVLKAREVTVFSFSLGVATLDGDRVQSVSFSIRCSKGTYIRSLARDIAKILGTEGCLLSLRRESIFPFNVKNSNKINVSFTTKPDVTVDAESGLTILPWWRIFEPSSFIPLTCNETECKMLQTGIFPERVSKLLHDFSACSRKNLTNDDKYQQIVIYSNPQQAPIGLLGCSVNFQGDPEWSRLFYQREEDNFL